MKKGKKILALALSVGLCASLLPQKLYAQKLGYQQNATQENPVVEKVADKQIENDSKKEITESKTKSLKAKGFANVKDSNVAVVDLDVADGIININDDGYWIGTGTSPIFINHKGSYNIHGTYIANKDSDFISRVIVTGGTEENPIPITLDNVTINNGFHKYGEGRYTGVSAIQIGSYSPWKAGNVNLNIKGNNTVIGDDNNAGIEVISIKQADGKALSSLVIEGDGVLNASSTGAGAGIGSGQQTTSEAYPKIMINSGTINATGGNRGAGIGGGKGCNGGEIIINGGNITAIGGDNAAGIGTGHQWSDFDLDANDTNIYIHGGTIKAQGGYAGAGIGNGYYQAGTDDVIADMTIQIDGTADVSATGGFGGAGIGGGFFAATSVATKNIISEIKIQGGNVKATGGERGAGIGSGLRSIVETIKIDNGTIVAKGGEYASGIGSTLTMSTDLITSKVNEIIINDGTINATGGIYSSAIGTGFTSANSPLSYVGNIDINGGDITAQGNYGGAGIGSGMTNSTSSDLTRISVNEITLDSAKVSSKGGDFGTGIGTGAYSRVGNISITSGNITAKGGIHGAGIGSGHTGTAGDILISGGKVNATSNYIMSDKGVTGNAAAIGSGLNGTAKSIELSGTDTEIFALAAPFAAGIGRGYHTTVPNTIIPITIKDTPNITAYAVGSINDNETFMQAIDYEGVVSSSQTLLMGHFKDILNENDAKEFKVELRNGKNYTQSMPAMFQSFAITSNVGVHRVFVDDVLYSGSIEKNEDNLSSTLSVNEQLLNAYWLLQPITSYNVVFESNEGSAVPSQIVGENEKVLEPANPTKEGYTFEGWYKEANFTNAWDFEKDIVTEDITLYAKWKKNEVAVDIYKVIFEFNGGSFKGQSTPIFEVDIFSNSDKLIKVYPEDKLVTKEGYKFTGWYRDEACTIKWDFEKDQVEGNMTLYAGWEKIETPEEPIEPDKPVTPEEPVKPADPTKPSTPNDPETPKTGDQTNVVLWTVLIMLSAGCLLVIKKKKKV